MNMNVNNNNLNLQAFIDIVGTGHKVLDGDLRIKNGVLQKVNFGSPQRRFFDWFFTNARCTTNETENKAVREALYRAVKSDIEGRIPGGANDEEVLGKLANLRRELGINEDESAKSEIALSRLTTRHIIQKYTTTRFDGMAAAQARDDTGKDNKDYYITKQTDRKGRQFVAARRFGGENGLLVTKEQFTKLFARALKLAVKSHKNEEAALTNLVNYYNGLFDDENASAEDFAVFFGDDRDFGECLKQGANSKYANSQLDFSLDSVAEKLWYVLQNKHPLPIMEGKDRKTAQVKILPGEFAEKIQEYSDRMRLVGEIESAVTFDRAPGANENAAADDQAAKLKRVREMVADLFFTEEDLTEMEKCGFGDGERIGRVLFRHQDLFMDICLEFERCRRSNSRSLQKTSAAYLAHQALAQIDEKLANAFDELIRKINSHLRFSEDKEHMPKLSITECQSKAQTIFKDIGSVGKDGFEAQLDKAIEGFFKKQEDGIYDKVCKDLNLPDPANDTDDSRFLKLVLESAFSVKSAGRGAGGKDHHLSLRRMLSAGTRFSKTKLGNREDFDRGAMLRGAGPSLLKRLQAYNKNDYNAELKPNVDSALNVITHSLQGMGDKLIRAQLYGVLMKLREDDPSIERISVSEENLGAASIAQTLLCKIHYKQVPGQAARQPEEVVIKLPRADVKMAFENERKGFETQELQQGQKTGAGGNQEAGQTAYSLLASIRNFINSVEPEFDFENETVNALLAMVEEESLGTNLIHSTALGKEEMNLYESEEDLNKDVVARVGCQFDGDRKFGTERLLFKPVDGQSEEELLQAVKNKVNALYESYKHNTDYEDGNRRVKINNHFDFLRELKAIAKNSCMGVSSGVVIMKKSSGTPIDGFIEGIARKTNITHDDLKKLILAKKSMLQLGEELFNGIAYGNPPTYHADLHGGNILYDPKSGKYTLIDYGKGFPLSTKEKDAIFTWFREVSKPYTDVEDELGSRTKAILSAYLDALDEEISTLEARNNAAPEGSDLKASTGKSLAFIRKSRYAVQLCLDPNAAVPDGVFGNNNEREKYRQKAQDLMKDITSALEDYGVSVGGRLEEILADFRAEELAVPDTLFGFFGSFAKLNKTLDKLDGLIEKAGYDKPVNLLDGDLRFGETEDNFGKIVNVVDNKVEFKSDDEIGKLVLNGKDKKTVMADFYSSIPLFIRRKTDTDARENKRISLENELGNLKEEMERLKDGGEDLLEENDAFLKGFNAPKHDWSYISGHNIDEEVEYEILRSSKNCWKFLDEINALGKKSGSSGVCKMVPRPDGGSEPKEIDKDALPKLTVALCNKIKELKDEVGTVTEGDVESILSGGKPKEGMPQGLQDCIKDFGAYRTYGGTSPDGDLANRLTTFINNEAKLQKMIALRNEIERKEYEKKTYIKEEKDGSAYATAMKPEEFTSEEAKKLYDLEGRCLLAYKRIKEQKKSINQNFAQLSGLFTACLSDYNKKKPAEENVVNQAEGV